MLVSFKATFEVKEFYNYFFQKLILELKIIHVSIYKLKIEHQKYLRQLGLTLILKIIKKIILYVTSF